MRIRRFLVIVGRWLDIVTPIVAVLLLVISSIVILAAIITIVDKTSSPMFNPDRTHK